MKKENDVLGKMFEESKKESEERKRKQKEYLEKEPLLQVILGYFWKQEQEEEPERIKSKNPPVKFEEETKNGNFVPLEIKV